MSRTTLAAVVAVLLTVTALWLTSRAVTPKEATWDDVLAEGRSGNYRIISTEELAVLKEQQGEALLLVDTRQEWEYRTGHIAGAINFPMEPTAWARWKKRGDLEKVLGADRERVIVFY